MKSGKAETSEVKKKLVIHLDTVNTILLADFEKNPDLTREDAVSTKQIFYVFFHS